MRKTSLFRACAGMLQNPKGRPLSIKISESVWVCREPSDLGELQGLGNRHYPGLSALRSVNPRLQPLGPPKETLISNGTSWSGRIPTVLSDPQPCSARWAAPFLLGLPCTSSHQTT